MLTRIAIALVTLSTTLHAAHIDLFVASGGADDAVGTADQPLATIAQAQQRVREYVAAGRASSVCLHIAGTHYLASPLEFTSADASAECAVTYRGEGDSATISGGVELGAWTLVEDVPEPMWQCDLAASEVADALPLRDLWNGTQRLTRARAPNTGFYRVAQAGPDNRTSFATDAEDFVPLANADEAEVVLLHDWSISRVAFARAEAGQHSYYFSDPIGGAMAQFAISNFEPHPRYFVEGAREHFDAAGEWYVDAAAKRLYYRPQADERIEDSRFVAPRAGQLVIVRGDEGRPVTNLAFENLTFAHTRFTLPPHGYAGVQSCWYERREAAGDSTGVTMPAAVELTRATDCQVRACQFRQLAACGLSITLSEGVEVDRCQFADIGGDGVLIGSRDGAPPAATHDITIADCTIERCGRSFYGAVGIWIGMAHNVIVEHNEVSQLPYTGISLGWQWDDLLTGSGGHQVRFNHIHDVMQLLSDGGGIYTLGRQPGTQLHHNVIHGVPLNSGRAESNGIFMDEGSSDILVTQNLIYAIERTPIRFHRAHGNTVESNRLVKSADVPPFLFQSCRQEDTTWRENTEIEATNREPIFNTAAGPRS